MITILYSEELKQYDFGPGHPFRGDRYDIFPKFLRENLAEAGNYNFVAAEVASDEDLSLICQQDYIEFSRGYYQATYQGLSYPGDVTRYQSPDNRPPGKPGQLETAAKLIIGQAKLAADLIEQDQADKVISLGGGMHHAKPDYGEGFCIYNDVAFATRYLQQKYDLDRILILDTDAHAGNGTAEYFYEDPKVLFIDLHQDPRTLYPGSGYSEEIGCGEGKGFTINVPLPLYAGPASYQMVFEEIVHPVNAEFKPQIIIRNGGSDPHVSDGLTNLGLKVESFRMIGAEVKEMANICEGRVIDLIGSGYNKEVLPHAWLALLCGLADIDTELHDPEPAPAWLTIDSFMQDIKAVIREVKSYHKDHWQCFR